MDLTVTITDKSAKRLLELAHSGITFQNDCGWYKAGFGHRPHDVKILNAFRSECESAKGEKL